MKRFIFMTLFGLTMLVLAGCSVETVTVYVQKSVLGPDDRLVIRYSDGSTVTSGVYAELTEDDFEYFEEELEGDTYFEQMLEYLVKFEVSADTQKDIVGAFFSDGTYNWSTGIQTGATSIPALYPMGLQDDTITFTIGDHMRFIYVDLQMQWGKPENVPAYAVLEAVEPVIDAMGQPMNDYQSLKLKIYDEQGQLVTGHAEVYGISRAGNTLRKKTYAGTYGFLSDSIIENFPGDTPEALPDYIDFTKSTEYLSVFTSNGEAVFAVETDAPSEAQPWTILSDTEFELYYGENKLPIHWHKVIPDPSEFDKTSPSDVSVNIVKPYSQVDAIEELLLNDESVDSEDYDYDAIASTLTLEDDFLAELESGEQVFTIRWESGYELQFTVLVGPMPAVHSVSVTPESASVEQGKSVQLTANVEAENGAAETVTWTSSDISGKVTVDNTGKVSVAADAQLGEYTITATSTFDETKSDTATITVTPDVYEPTVISVSVSPETASVAQGHSLQLTATVEVEDDAAETVTWSSSDASGKVAVDETGNVTVAGDAVPGEYTITATSTFDDSKFASATITVTQSGGSSDSGSSSAPQPEPEDEVYVLVNGKMEYAGKAANSERDGRTVTTITVDQDKLNEKLAAEGQGAIVTIPVNAQSDIVIGELNGEMIRNMQDKQAVVQVQTEQATYTIPAEQIGINAISGQFGNTVGLQDIKVHIEISAPNGDTVQWIENKAEEGTFTVVVPPLDFKVRATYGDTTIDVTKFTEYVERMIAIPEGVDPGKITTGVVVEPDGTVRHVPTQVKQIDGKYYAIINSLTNSTYTVVWHPIEFADMANHWAKSAVNEMGSRMVVEGTGDGRFSPDLNITRAEFAAIVVRGLGLKQESGATSFSDVKASDWYSGAVRTASEYGLINGFEDGTFRPNDLITREQAMVIIAKAMKLTGLNSNPGAPSAEAVLRAFEDAGAVSAWAKIGAADAVKAGIVTGRSANMLAPKGYVTRAEAAALIQRLLKESELI